VAETVQNLSAIAIAMAVEPQYVCGAAYFICTVKGNQVSPRARTLTLPGEKGGKKQQKIRS
jgi:hypothetical protein